MLIRLPPQFSADRSASPRASAVVRQPFATELRRDLSEQDVVVYRKPIGGGLKRAIEFTVAALTLPIWGIAYLCVLVALMRRGGGAGVFASDEIIGYGGRSFSCRRFRWIRPSADIVALRPEADTANAVNDQSAAPAATSVEPEYESVQTPWFRSLTRDDILERLPMMLHVLGGSMSLIGPPGLSRDQFKDLKMARKFYASARPGVINVCDADAPTAVLAGVVKDYAGLWSLDLDAQVLALALRQIKTGA
jgi:lipopolysaccharide/colanic/teichoic acid biosynthesis glycosyltransferase